MIPTSTLNKLLRSILYRTNNSYSQSTGSIIQRKAEISNYHFILICGESYPPYSYLVSDGLASIRNGTNNNTEAHRDGITFIPDNYVISPFGTKLGHGRQGSRGMATTYSSPVM